MSPGRTPREGAAGRGGERRGVFSVVHVVGDVVVLGCCHVADADTCLAAGGTDSGVQTGEQVWTDEQVRSRDHGQERFKASVVDEVASPLAVVTQRSWPAAS